MFNQNIISNKFNLKLVNNVSYTVTQVKNPIARNNVCEKAGAYPSGVASLRKASFSQGYKTYLLLANLFQPSLIFESKTKEKKGFRD